MIKDDSGYEVWMRREKQLQRRRKYLKAGLYLAGIGASFLLGNLFSGGSPSLEKELVGARVSFPNDIYFHYSVDKDRTSDEWERRNFKVGEDGLYFSEVLETGKTKEEPAGF